MSNRRFVIPVETSLLTARRPDITRVYDNEVYFRDLNNYTTLPQYFKDNGYITAGYGKIYHDYINDPPSWTEPYYQAPTLALWYYDIIQTENGTASWSNVPKTVTEKLPFAG